MTIPGPLSGYRILDMTTVVGGPYAAQMMGDFGADVIKIEAPGGDIVRQSGFSPDPGFGALFMTLNRNKRSIVLDLKRTEAQLAMKALIQSADAIITNIRPAALQRLGYAYDQVQAWNPDIIYVNMVGYGSDGPYADRAAYDDLIQAASGATAMMSYVSPDGEYRYMPTLIVDKTVGLHVANATLAALLHRERTGDGQVVEVPMFECMVSFLMIEHLSGEVWKPALDSVGYKRMLHDRCKPFKTKDGYVAIIPYIEQHWLDLFTLGGREDMHADSRLSTMAQRRIHTKALYEIIESFMVDRTSAEWMPLLQEHRIPHMLVNSLETLLEDEHLKATGFFEERHHPSQGDYISMRPPIKFAAAPADVKAEPPPLGADGPQILREIGISNDAIVSLTEVGALYP
ncbi:MAG: CoA transferase [Chloroflexota bacterium]